ncbi:MAG TPA: NAD(P)H-binding protein [Acidimicrobiia bacterium]
MPVIVVGADTPEGRAIFDGLISPGREIRVFVSDPDTAAGFREKGAKVAVGDVSDDSHIEAAAASCFTAVLVTPAIDDGREISFATGSNQVLHRWATAVAGVRRVIWVHDGEVPPVSQAEIARVEPGDPDLVTKVVALDEVRELKTPPT